MKSSPSPARRSRDRPAIIAACAGGSPMSRFASLPTVDEIRAKGRTRRGPSGACDIYGPGDIEDWREIESRRLDTSWAQIQREVDSHLAIERPIHLDKFRYHWRRRCWHWDDEQRQATL